MGKDGDPGGQPASSKDPKLQAIKVRLLDGTSRDFELPRGSSGDALFALVSNLLNLSIEEREYFSLCFYDTEGTRHWLYNDKKILRQLKGLPWEFCFEVKFYPTIPSSLNDDHARYNLFLQLKHDVSTGRLPATIETHAILGSLVAQAEFGDAKPTAEYEQYLRTTKFAPQNSDQLIEMIAQKHKEHKGLTPAEAENLYMDTCKQQTMYGIFVFNAKDNKNVPVGIGVCAHGIYIYKEQIRVNRFPWQGIIKICYRKAQFAIKLKAGEIDKKEATVTYKVADYEHAKRIWKCAVEHHTFFRLIQPDEKPKSSLFRWGSARFRYQGRTQFQTKMASQMFDKPHQTAVQRFDSARLTHSLDNVAREQAPSGHVSPLHYADNELGAREPMASPAVSYEVSGQNEKRKLDDKVGNGLPSDDDELVYTPVESPSSAAYYLSERSSACSPNSNDFVFSQQMRSATTPYSWRTNDRDQSSSAASGGVYYPCTESVKGSRSLPQQASTSTHSAIDSIEKRAEMEQRPINDSVHVYHPGNYQNLRHQPRPVNLFSNDVNNQRNGVTAVRRLGPDNEMDRHPIRYFVDVQHSGASQIPRVSRVRHPGKEEIGPAVLSNYSFSKSPDTSVPVQRLEPQRDVTCHNIRQYSSVYHPGSSQISASKSLEDDSPTVRLVARVQPASLPQERSQPSSLPRERSQPASDNNGALEVSSRLEEPYDAKRNGESSSGILKFWKIKDRKHGEKNKRHSKTENESEQNGESKAFIGQTAVITTGTRPIEERERQEKAAVTSHPSTSNGSQLREENGSERAYTSTTEIAHRRWRHEDDEETVEKDQVRPETYGVASTSYAGPLESTARQSELQSAPLRDYAQAYHHGQSWDAGKGVKTPTSESEHTAGKKAVLHLRTSPVKEKPSPTAQEEEARRIRLIARVPHSTSEEEPDSSKPRKEQDSSGLFGFWKTGKGKQRGGPADESAYPTSAKYAGPLDDVNRQRDIDEIPFKAPAAVAYKPSADVPESAHHRVHLFGRWRHEGDEETVEKDQVRPETYGVASTSYAGPLESTARQSELQSAPLREYAQAYHHGQSWDAGKDVKTPTSESEHTAGKKAVLHLRTSPVKEKHSPTAQEEEARRIRLIARVPHSTSEEEPDLSKSGKEIEKQMSSGGRKTFIAAENYGITRTGPISVKSLQSDEVDEEMGGGSACSKLWSGTHPHSDVTTSKTKSTSSSLMEPLTGHSAIDRDRPITLSNRHVGRLERTTMSGEEYVEVRVDRRVEIQLEPAFCLTGAGLSAVSEDEDGLIFSVTPPPMPSSDRSFFSRLLFKGSSKKSKKQKKGTKETDSSDSSGSSDDEKNQVHIVPVESGGVTLPLYKDPEDKDGKLVRRETNELKYHLKGEGISPGFDPQNPESGQPHTTISTWQESSRLPDEVTTEYDEKGNKITRTLKTSQVKHTVQKQTFQNYVVPTDGQAGVVTVERVREETTPLGTIALATNGSAGSPHVVETHSRSVAYEADPNEAQHEGLGEFVSCKTLTSGNRTVETYTYKTERDGIIETHVEHRVTIHSDEPIDHDAELSQAIMEATQMNPDMTVEKIEVRQESTA